MVQESSIALRTATNSIKMMNRRDCGDALAPVDVSSRSKFISPPRVTVYTLASDVIGELAVSIGARSSLYEDADVSDLLATVAVQDVRNIAAKFFDVAWQHTRVLFADEDVTDQALLNIDTTELDGEEAQQIYAGVDSEKSSWLKALQGLKKFRYLSWRDRGRTGAEVPRWRFHRYEASCDRIVCQWVCKLLQDEERTPRYILEDIEILKAAFQLDHEGCMRLSVDLQDEILWSRSFLEAHCVGEGDSCREWALRFCYLNAERLFDEFPDLAVVVSGAVIKTDVLANEMYGMMDFVGKFVKRLTLRSRSGDSIFFDSSRDPNFSISGASCRELLLSCLSTNGWVLSHCDDDVRRDKELTLAAVRNHGLALAHISEELHGDDDERDLVLAACAQDGDAFGYASAQLLDDRDFVQKVVQVSGRALFRCSRELREDRELVELAVRQDPNVFADVSKELRRDQDLAKVVVSQDGNLVDAVIDPIRSVVLAAVGKTPKLLLSDDKIPAEYLQTYDDELAMLALRGGGLVYNRLRQIISSERARRGDPDVDIDVDIDFLLRSMEASGNLVVEHISGVYTRDLRLLAEFRTEKFREVVRTCERPHAVLTNMLRNPESRAWIESFGYGGSAGSSLPGSVATPERTKTASALEELIVAALACNGNLLEYAGCLRDNAEAVVTATTNTGRAFGFASDRLRGDVRFVYRLLRLGCALQQHDWLDKFGDVITVTSTSRGASLSEEQPRLFLDFFTGWQTLQDTAPEQAFALAHMALEKGYRLRNVPLADLQDDYTLQEVDRLYVHHVSGPCLMLDEKTTIYDIIDELYPTEKRAESYEGFLDILDKRNLRAPPIPDGDE
ncbi:unnamed protein product [Amoebophrya sp. A25]|nr:unnamed protein product [Amoebophrya sp. A25]|eukprot:GSA25T00004165001.1